MGATGILPTQNALLEETGEFNPQSWLKLTTFNIESELNNKAVRWTGESCGYAARSTPPGMKMFCDSLLKGARNAPLQSARLLTTF